MINGEIVTKYGVSSLKLNALYVILNKKDTFVYYYIRRM